MTSPPLSTPWLPLWPSKGVVYSQPPSSVLPVPVDGRYVKSPGTWEALPPPPPGIYTPDADWHILGAANEPQFWNGWDHYPSPAYGSARFRKLADGLVVLEGLIINGTAQTDAFYLPPGYRADAEATGTGHISHFYTASSNGPAPWGTVWFFEDGRVRPNFGGGYFTALEGIHFYARQFTSFTPTDLSGLAVWLDASQLAGGDGSSVTSWPNLASGGVAVTQVGTPVPTILAPGKNGLKVVRFVGLTGGGFQASSTGVDQNHTMAIVARYSNATAATQQRIISGLGAANLVAGWHGAAEDLAYMGGSGWFTPLGSTGRPGTTNWRLYGTDAPAGAGTGSRLFANGTVIGTGVASTLGWQNVLSLGGHLGQANQGSDCEIAEVVMYNRRLTDSERQRLEYYLYTKWAITPR